MSTTTQGGDVSTKEIEQSESATFALPTLTNYLPPPQLISALRLAGLQVVPPSLALLLQVSCTPAIIYCVKGAPYTANGERLSASGFVFPFTKDLLIYLQPSAYMLHRSVRSYLCVLHVWVPTGVSTWREGVIKVTAWGGEEENEWHTGSVDDIIDVNVYFGD
ncbi:hypothetical protein B296_00031029 [Ensete ventricosum]|uniref:Jacalin-type lectin domain-containing protein n=1 Tax=Ensete ventricosum TaxID=4639 RepID=A0A426ZHJ0_ENSVE|nr:hypothetical protein B296_00031029 [Ensete ventricosum]